MISLVRKLALLTCLLAVFAALVVGCGGSKKEGSSSSTSPTAASGVGAAQNVNVGDFQYSPSTMTAKLGQPVSFTLRNSGPATHTFTIDNVIDSGQVAPGANKPVSFTPTATGILTYYCTVHGKNTMSGTLTVTAQ